MRHIKQTQLVARHPVRRLSHLLVAAVCLLLSPCMAIHIPSPQTQHPLYSNPLAKWEGCGELNGYKLECTRIDVPMDHFNQSASNKTFSIPLIRMLVTNTSAFVGKTILVSPGGPGGSGIDFLWRAGKNLSRVIGEGFHLLSFDARGVNGSIPLASCYVSSQQRVEQIEAIPWDLYFEAGKMFTKAENAAKACADTAGEHGAYVNTPQTAADMNSILDAIGQKEMYYWGFSYGTALGQTYAQMFPERVTRLIIDGVTNLNDWYNEFLENESLIDTDKVYAGFVHKCFEAKENCALNSIDGTAFKTATDLQRYLDGFLERLEEEPIPVYLNNSNYGAILRRGLVGGGILPAAYSPKRWPSLAENLADLLKGNTTAAYNAYPANWVESDLSDDTNTFVTQNDNWKTGPNAPVHGIKSIQNFSLSAPEVSKLYTRYQASDIYVRASWSIPTTHNFHPQYYPEFPKFKTANPILILSTTYDPVCPLVSAKTAYNSFEGAGILEQTSYGHCSISMPSLCTAKHVQRYFYDGLLPDSGAKCDIDIEYFPRPDSESSVKSLKQEDVDLLAALQELSNLVII